MNASHANPGGSNHPPPPPDRTDSGRQSRTFVACVNCRRLKARCVQPEGSRNGACTRCKMRNITCEYPLPYFYYGEPSRTSVSGLPSGPGHYHGRTFYPPYGAPDSASSVPLYAPPAPTPARGPPPPPIVGHDAPLPYTGPPPPFMRPRYSDGVPYPNLALGDEWSQSGSQSTTSTAGYPPNADVFYPGAEIHFDWDGRSEFGPGTPSYLPGTPRG